MDTTLLAQLGVGLALFAGGLGAGLALRRRGDPKARVLELEGELNEARQQLDTYRAQVEKHFERTSDLFRDLTDQYSALYGHLSEGARALCPEGGPAIGLGLNDPLLEPGSVLAGDEPLDEARDLEDLTGPGERESLDEEPERQAPDR